MSFTDPLITRLTAAGIVVVDLRGKLPRNTTWPLIQAWGQRPVSAISIISHHYPAGPPHPPVPYDETGRLAAFARQHVNQVWAYDGGRPLHAPTITYHLANGGSGRLYVLNEATDQTWHANNANPIALGILHDVGEGQEPTLEQLVTLQRVCDVLSQQCPEIPAGQGDHWGHGELTSFGNATQCPGRMLDYVQRYRATGFVVEAPPPPTPPPPPEEIEMLTDEEIANLIAAPLFAPFPFTPGFAIPDAWIKELRAGRYRGVPLSPETELGEGRTWQRFEQGIVVYVPGQGVSWTG